VWQNFAMLVSFAYRNLDDVKKKVMRIREGGSNADMVQDLIELAVLGVYFNQEVPHLSIEKYTT
jgi:hypothetical protein